MTLDVLFIDNFDSFTFNLVDEFARRGANVEVWRNDISVTEALRLLDEMSPRRLLVLSPGPGSPGEAGCCTELVRRAPEQMPILGVCLGHQAIVESYGGLIGHAPQVMHGMASTIRHDGRGIFHNLPQDLRVARYHSLCAVSMPDVLEVSASCGEVVMAARHRTRPVVGVQFHPESILTRSGGQLIENMIELARGAACS
jgi:anthranilate synthase component 2